MKNIFATAYYTFIKYIRNPIAMAAYILAPVFMIFMLTGSADYKFSSINIPSKSFGSSANIINHIINSDHSVIMKNSKISIVVITIFLFYSAILGSYLILHDLKSGLNNRLKASPMTTAENIIGKSLGCVGLMTIYSIILMAVTKVMCQISWEKNLIFSLAAFVFFLITVNSIGIILTAAIKNIYICALGTFALNFSTCFSVMVFIFSPVTLTDSLALINKFSIHYYVLRTVTDAMENNLSLSLNSLIVLFFISIASFLLALFVGKKVLK